MTLPDFNSMTYEDLKACEDTQQKRAETITEEELETLSTSELRYLTPPDYWLRMEEEEYADAYAADPAGDMRRAILEKQRGEFISYEELRAKSPEHIANKEWYLKRNYPRYWAKLCAKRGE